MSERFPQTFMGRWQMIATLDAVRLRVPVKRGRGQRRSRRPVATRPVVLSYETWRNLMVAP